MLMWRGKGKRRKIHKYSNHKGKETKYKIEAMLK
jgi:hypothetical protein